MAALAEYTWLFVVGIGLAFMDSFGIGANDVANSFATSVGSRSLTLKGALLIALFTEFGGALALGASVASTIKNKIIDITAFEATPELLMLGFIASLAGSSIWVLTASRLGWPVSTTHSTIGALIGVGIASYGGGIVNWEWEGVGKVIASWFISPVLAGVVASFIFLVTRTFVLNTQNSFQRGLRAIPFYFGTTVAISTLYVILKNGKKQEITAENAGVIIGSSVAAGAGVAILIVLFYVPWLKRRIEGREHLKWYHVFYIHYVPQQEVDENTEGYLSHATNQGTYERDLERVSTGGNESDNSFTKLLKKSKKALTNGLNKDVATMQGEHIQKVHDHSPRFESKTEFLYSFLQVLTAAFASFAHGSNDVANAIGPFAGAYDTWRTGEITSKSNIPIWMLAFGGAAIDLGLLFMGWRVMKSLGNNLTYHSPARGFSMELGAAITVITASFLEIPVSTTHCITGATAAVGLVSGTSWKSLNYKMLSWCFFSWIVTLPVAGTIAGVFFAVLARSPSF